MDGRLRKGYIQSHERWETMAAPLCNYDQLNFNIKIRQLKTSKCWNRMDINKRGFMRTKHSTLGLIILLSCILLSACDGSVMSGPTSQIGVSPLNTASAGLILIMNIEEDQNATDGK